MKHVASDETATRVKDLVLERAPSEERKQYSSKPLWRALTQTGTELWLDTGDIEEIEALWTADFRGLTTNNTLLNKEVQKGIYDDLVTAVAAELRREASEEDLVLEIAFVLNAVHGLRLSRRFGAKVSVELHTDLADDVEAAVHYGRRFHAIAPEAFYVKVPLTPAGLLAARRLSEEGVLVNFTLGFSARQNALITALARPAFVNVFLGRLNAFVADSNLGNGEMVGEKATLASLRAVHDVRSALRLGTRQIAASMREGAQVAALAGVDVQTMPTKVAREFEQMASPSRPITSQAEADPPVELASGVDRQALGIDALWRVPDALKSAVIELQEQDLSAFRSEDVVAFIADKGFGDLLPAWSEKDVERVVADGKIPHYSYWKDRLAAGEVGLDALMNLSGVYSFAADQKAMDDRIRSLL